MAVKVQVKGFQVVTLCSFAEGYHHLREPHCLYLQDAVNGAREMGIDMGIEYGGGAQSPAANRKWERVIWQTEKAAVNERQGNVLDWLLHTAHERAV